MPQRNSAPSAADKLALVKPPCPRCGARTLSVWTWLVGLAWLLFFPAGAALTLVRPTFRCWTCGCRFKGVRAVPVPARAGR